MLTMKRMTSNNQQRNHTMTTHRKRLFIHLGWLGYVVSTNSKKIQKKSNIIRQGRNLMSTMITKTSKNQQKNYIMITYTTRS